MDNFKISLMYRLGGMKTVFFKTSKWQRPGWNYANKWAQSD